MAEPAFEPANTGSDKDQLDAAIANVERYLLCSKLLAQAFQIVEKRGIFWWSLHKLLDDPKKPVSFKDLSAFLDTQTKNDYTKHQIQVALITLQRKEKGYISMSNADRSADGGQTTGSLTKGQINNATIIRLEAPFFDGIARYGQEFREAIAPDRTIRVSDLEIYNGVNELFRNQYNNDWYKLVGEIGALGHQLGGQSKLAIEQRLSRYGNHWVTIIYLWKQHLMAKRGGPEPAFLTANQLGHQLSQYTYVPSDDLGDILSFLRNDAKLIERSNGRASYRIAEAFHPILWEFTHRTMAIFDKFLDAIS